MSTAALQSTFIYPHVNFTVQFFLHTNVCLMYNVLNIIQASI